MANKNRQVFIVRIWRESREIKGKLPEWRGEIECANTNERRYFKSLDEIITFIKPFLVRMGVQVDGQRRLNQWLSQGKRLFSKKPEAET